MAEPTKYLVFKAVPEVAQLDGQTVTDKVTWLLVNEVEAHSPRAAMQAAATELGEGGEFAAVPARSWHADKLVSEQRLVFS
jgi:hypothetical protein